MPHFIMDCSEDVLTLQTSQTILEKVHNTALTTGLFVENEIKVRLNPFNIFSVGNQKQDFIHIFGYIMQGRTNEEKAHLSQQLVASLTSLFPEVPNIAINISDFEKASYCNKAMLNNHTQ